MAFRVSPPADLRLQVLPNWGAKGVSGRARRSAARPSLYLDGTYPPRSRSRTYPYRTYPFFRPTPPPYSRVLQRPMVPLRSICRVIYKEPFTAIRSSTICSMAPGNQPYAKPEIGVKRRFLRTARGLYGWNLSRSPSSPLASYFLSWPDSNYKTHCIAH